MDKCHFVSLQIPILDANLIQYLRTKLRFFYKIHEYTSVTVITVIDCSKLALASVLSKTPTMYIYKHYSRKGEKKRM